jgi:hypothetical protein
MSGYRSFSVNIRSFSYTHIFRNRFRYRLFAPAPVFGKKNGNGNGRFSFRSFPFVFIPRHKGRDDPMECRTVRDHARTVLPCSQSIHRFSEDGGNSRPGYESIDIP